MDIDTVKTSLYHLNEDELFYRKYYYARQQEYSLKKFLAELNMDYVHKRNLLILEDASTIPPRFEDSFYFDSADSKSIVVMKHNCYSPALVHSHTFFELLYVYDGACQQKLNNSVIRLHTGDICIIPPGISHSIEVFDESVVINVLIRKSTLHNIFYTFLRTPNILSAFFLNNIYSKNGNDYIIFHSGIDEEIKRNFLYILYEHINKDDYCYQIISNTVMLIFALLIRNYERSIELPTFTEKADVQRFALLQYIQDHFTSISLEDVAERFHFTPEYTSKLIKSTTGQTFTEILRKVRIERAQVLLQDTNMSVADIGAQVGYETPEHFIRTFKKVVGISPTGYRRRKYVI